MGNLVGGLNVKGGKVSFASYGKTWHGLGTVLNDRMTSVEALQYGGLDFKVEKTETFFQNSNGELNSTGHFHTYRTDTNQSLGNVGKNYKVIQNNEVFKMLDGLVDRNEAVYETVGCLGNGETTFLTAKLPGHISIKGLDDLTEMYVVLINNHSGKHCASGLITPVRVVCSNTLSSAVYKSVNKVVIRHSSNAEYRMRQAKEVLGITNNLTEQLNECYNYLYECKIGSKATKELVEKFIEVKEEGLTKQQLDKYDKIMEFYESGVGQDFIKGTKWGVFNAFTGYLDHVKKYKNEDRKMEVLITGKQRKRALDLVLNA